MNNNDDKEKHFSNTYLIALVVFIFLCLIVVPQILLNIDWCSRCSNEKRACTRLRIIYVAEKDYQEHYGDGDFISDLTKIDKFTSLDENIQKMQKVPMDGYLLGEIKVIPKSKSSKAEFSVIALPAIKSGVKRTGNDCFYIDQSGILRHSGSPTIIPNSNSPVFSQ